MLSLEALINEHILSVSSGLAILTTGKDQNRKMAKNELEFMFLLESAFLFKINFIINYSYFPIYKQEDFPA